jgi:hypothetical protein
MSVALGTVPAAGLTVPDLGVTTRADWQSRRRPELLDLFRTHVYGRNPVEQPAGQKFTTTGTATNRQVIIELPGPRGVVNLKLDVTLPSHLTHPIPCFLLINHRKNPPPAAFFPIPRIVQRGFAAVLLHARDVAPDANDGNRTGVFAAFDTDRPADAWGTIAAWAWAASRAMDYIVTDPVIDPNRVAVAGHSRSGKAALWCGAQDERFALVISNNSGCTGAALTRGKVGERIRDINERFPHWFCANYKWFNDRESDLPVDQHQLLALIAPRLLYVASASEDDWADPAAERRACALAAPAYALFGHGGLGAPIGYHVRPGQHDLTETDWNHFMNFADKYWK